MEKSRLYFLTPNNWHLHSDQTLKTMVSNANVLITSICRKLESEHPITGLLPTWIASVSGEAPTWDGQLSDFSSPLIQTVMSAELGRCCNVACPNVLCPHDSDASRRALSNGANLEFGATHNNGDNGWKLSRRRQNRSSSFVQPCAARLSWKFFNSKKHKILYKGNALFAKIQLVGQYIGFTKDWGLYKAHVYVFH